VVAEGRDRLIQATKIAPACVDGALRCQCGAPLHKDGSCPQGHAAAGLGAVGNLLVSEARILSIQAEVWGEGARLVQAAPLYGSFNTPAGQALAGYVPDVVRTALRRLVLATVGEHVGHASHAAPARRKHRRGPRKDRPAGVEPPVTAEET